MTTNPKAGQPDTGVDSDNAEGTIERLRNAIELGEKTGSRGRHPFNIYNVAADALDLITALQSQLDTVTRERDRLEGELDLVAKQMRYIAKSNATNFDRVEAAERERDAMREALDHADRYATSLGATRDHPLRVTIRKALQPETSK